MGYVDFLSCLFNGGRVVVPNIAQLTHDELRAGDELIAEYEHVYRLAMPSEPPEFVGSAACWAATKFFRACQFVVYRDFGEEILNDELRKPLTEVVSPSIHYSVDLVFRYLPDLSKFLDFLATAKPPPLEHPATA